MDKKGAGTRRAHEQFGTMRNLMLLVDILRPLGLKGTVREVVETIDKYVKQNKRAAGGWAVTINSKRIKEAVKDYRHQEIIDTITEIKKTCDNAPTYEAIYPRYCRRCRQERIKPFSLKTFKNRARVPAEERRQSKRNNACERKAKRLASDGQTSPKH